MISIFIWLLLVGTLESQLIRNRRATLCSWAGHCAGDPCSSYDDCDGSMICVNGKCGNSGGGGGGTGVDSGTCSPSGVLKGKGTNCNQENMSECCKKGVNYPQYTCSPASKSTALLTLNSFKEGGDGGGAGACFEQYYPDSQQVVALSTGWYNGGSRCGKYITISANGKTTKAMVVDQCDSVNGCDDEHAGQPPCRNNIVDGSPAVWAALGIKESDPRYGEISISWSD